MKAILIYLALLTTPTFALKCDKPDKAFMKMLPGSLGLEHNLFPNDCMDFYFNNALGKKKDILSRKFGNEQFKDANAKKELKDQIYGVTGSQHFASLLSATYLLLEVPRYEILMEATREISSKNFFSRIWNFFFSYFSDPEPSYRYRHSTALDLIQGLNRNALLNVVGTKDLLKIQMEKIYSPQCSLFAPALMMAIGSTIMDSVVDGTKNEYLKIPVFFRSWFKTSFKSSFSAPNAKVRFLNLQKRKAEEDLTPEEKAQMLKYLLQSIIYERQLKLHQSLQIYFNMMEWYRWEMLWTRTAVYDPDRNPFWNDLNSFGKALLEAGLYGIYEAREVFNQEIADEAGDEIFSWLLTEFNVDLKQLEHGFDHRDTSSLRKPLDSCLLSDEKSSSS
jgi:hypothetical protein